MVSIPPQSAFSPQEYQVMYLSIGQNLLTEVQSINVVRTDGGADVQTLVRDYGGRVKGAAKADITFKGVIPYIPTDTGGGGGEGFSSAGMLAGAAPGAGPAQLDATILTSINQYSNQPVQFAVQIGNPAAQTLSFKGFIHQMTVDVSVGKQADFTCMASGEFAIFG